MAMAKPLSSAKTRPAILCLMCLLFIAVAAVNEAVLVAAHSPLVVYVHEDRISANKTSVIISPSGGSVIEFGTIAVLDNVLREGVAGDSPVLGTVKGQVTVEKDLSLYLSLTYVLKSPSYSGTISTQGATDPLGTGEVAVTGGTGDFRYARGYVEELLITEEDLANVVFKNTFYIKYD